MNKKLVIISLIVGVGSVLLLVLEEDGLAIITFGE
jgi:hypothetical protein